MKKTILGFILLFTFLTLTGCGVKQVDVADFLECKESGSNGNGKLEVTINSDIMASKQFREAFKDKLNISHLSDAYKITVTPSKSENLSNGDTVDLNLSYNKDLFKDEFNVELVNSKKTYTINNLEHKFRKQSDLKHSDYLKIKEKADKEIDALVKEDTQDFNCTFSNFKFLGTYLISDDDNSSLCFLYNSNVKQPDVANLLSDNFITKNTFFSVEFNEFKFDKNKNLTEFKTSTSPISIKAFNLNEQVDLHNQKTLKEILNIDNSNITKLDINFNK